jgi:hypothetical protein
MVRDNYLRLLAVSIVYLLLIGCASMYFDDAGAPPEPSQQYSLAQWPYRDYWTGIIFNGNKIGFAHLNVTPDGELYRIESQASFALRFLGIEKKIRLESSDWVDEQLRLRRFAYDYNLDGSELRLSGEIVDKTLRVALDNAGQHSEQTHMLTEPVYPTGALPLFPLLHGLSIGRQYRYMVYDGETQTLAQAEQKIEGYETSKLFEGPAYKVKTSLHGHSSTTWVNHRGLPLLEIALNGVLISALESESQAKRYLVMASLNKDETLLDFSRVRSDRKIENPRGVTRLNVALRGLDAAHLPPPDAGQSCRGEGNEVVCEIRRATASASKEPPINSVRGEPVEPRTDTAVTDPSTAPKAVYLKSSFIVPSDHPRLRAEAATITGDAPSAQAKIERLVAWMQTNLAREAVDAFSALDVYERRKAECQGHSWLYAAFARSLGIPTRVVNGIVYSEDLDGFYYHTWNESWLDGRWLPVDATFGQIGADATHIKLIEGESVADLLPLIELIGKLELRVVDYARD